MECDTCAYYAYDEEEDEYCCTVYMDEDDAARLSGRETKSCPFWKNGDEYVVVRHQI